MRGIALGGSACLVALVDDEDFARVSAKHWRALRKSKGLKGYYAQEYGSSLLMHRFILNAPTGIEVDHRNNDGLDNQRQNLRLASRRQNACNQILRPNSTGFRGVYFQTGPPSPSRKPFIARITVNYKRINLGSFLSAEEAARAFDAAARELHGEFARLNFPDK